MSMLAEFLDCTKNSRSLFTDTKISDSYVMQELNSHPVIFLSFLNVKGDTAEELFYQLELVIKEEFEKFLFLTQEESLPDIKKKHSIRFTNAYVRQGTVFRKRTVSAMPLQNYVKY